MKEKSGTDPPARSDANCNEAIDLFHRAAEAGCADPRHENGRASSVPQDRDAAERSIASLESSGDALLTNTDTFCAQFERVERRTAS
jgi:hypothetical protein